jgi:RimJ/RimL family protein N-acetyltransferase
VEWSEIRSTMVYRAPFRPIVRWVTLGAVAVSSAVFMAVLFNVLSILALSNAVFSAIFVMALLLTILLIRFSEKRIHRGAVAVDWHGVTFNGIFRTRYQPWRFVLYADEFGVHLSNNKTITFSRFVKDSVGLRLISEVESRRFQTQYISAVQLPGRDVSLPFGNLTLRPWRPADHVAFHGLFSSRTIRDAHEFRPMSSGQAQRFVKAFHRAELPHAEFVRHWAIESMASPRELAVIGHFDVWLTRFKPATLCIAYGFEQRYQGYGQMTSLIRTVTREALESWGISEFEATCRSNNLPSRRVLEKCGFEVLLADPKQNAQMLKYVLRG